MLDNGFRSKCCSSTIRLGEKRIKNSLLKKKIWVCNKCGSRDVNIIPKNEIKEKL